MKEMWDKIVDFWGTTTGKIVLIFVPLLLIMMVWMFTTKKGKLFKSKIFGGKKRTFRRRPRLKRNNYRTFKRTRRYPRRGFRNFGVNFRRGYTRKRITRKSRR